MASKRTSSEILERVGSDRGLTLIEVIVAFTILAIAGLGLFSVGSLSTVGNTRNADQVAAGALASAKLEDLRNTSFDSLASSTSNESLTAGGASGGEFSRSWTVTNTTISGLTTQAKTLTVTVSWTGGGTVSMSTMVIKPSQAVTDFDTGFPTAAIQNMEQTQ